MDGERVGNQGRAAGEIVFWANLDDERDSKQDEGR